MAFGKINIEIDIEPIHKVTCFNQNCRYHLIEKDYMHCNLKHLELDEHGQCMQFEHKEKQHD